MNGGKENREDRGCERVILVYYNMGLVFIMLSLIHMISPPGIKEKYKTIRVVVNKSSARSKPLYLEVKPKV